jgi:hypothetical protein
MVARHCTIIAVEQDHYLVGFNKDEDPNSSALTAVFPKPRRCGDRKSVHW